MNNDWLPVTFLVQLSLPLLAVLATRNRHHVEVDGADVFRVSPVAAWFILLGGVVVMIIGGVIEWTAPPRQAIPPLTLWVSEIVFSLMAVYGVYCVTMRIWVDEETFAITSFLGRRVIPFSEIGSTVDRVTGNFRTLDVKTRNGKRVLYITSNFVADYDELVGLLQDGAKKNHLVQQ